MSVFVNPLQFAPTDDFAAYPRDLARDAQLASDRGVDIVFAPAVAEMYPRPARVVVTPAPGGSALDTRWEGAARPGHFAGVLTVVAKLFHVIQPDVALFGRKDLQQATLIRAMVQDLDLGIEVVTVPTVRSEDGLALSSRNAYLSASERARALVIPQSLRAMVEAWRAQGIRDSAALVAVGRQVLAREPSIAVDYLGVAEAEALEPVVQADAGAVAMIAARVGRTRLIDNVVFDNVVFDVGDAAATGRRSHRGPRHPTGDARSSRGWRRSSTHGRAR
jgi:pantoate--beta-alanine ligase